jgi:hypothetical protein
MKLLIAGINMSLAFSVGLTSPLLPAKLTLLLLATSFNREFNGAKQFVDTAEAVKDDVITQMSPP